MIQLIIFDLDGVLVDSKEMHYNSLNKALSHENIYISPEEQSSTYEGMSTRVKLNLLTEKKGLAQTAHDLIWRRKQQYTDHYIRSYTHDDRIRSILKTLKEEGYMLYVASNAIAQTVKNILYYKGFLEYIDRYVSNQDVQRPKPYPDIYFKCM